MATPTSEDQVCKDYVDLQKISTQIMSTSKRHRLKSRRPLKGISKDYVDLQKASTQLTPTFKRHRQKICRPPKSIDSNHADL
ncbi:Gibberellin 2-beta-dioxygenase 2 [Sesbania bispinosa]|nr:Gibberellin 2-beta-dioxygenase 2 [Sesbania bispinosa]